MRRHDLVEISDQGRELAFERVAPHLPPREFELVKQLIIGTPGGIKIPGIVRREDRKQIPDTIPVGFSSPFRIDGNRLRIAGFVPTSAVIQVVSPFAVIDREFFLRTPCLNALVEVLAVAGELGLKLGVWGSSALEIFTGLQYTDEASDLDVLVGMTRLDTIRTFTNRLAEIARTFHCKVDAELELNSGYGVKVAELFMHTDTVLAKGLNDVILLPKHDILAEMTEVQ
ncbi:malonate decarboxylase holo-[acyl-carrier-protein] synthase [Pelosinus fermentans]|uniref:malonate decarboxylase holo-[acyl-carrier-protein] synthase n=1 Tax=Pelosinus fermentans TaxID=365349 RepID=UPI0022862089|nr:malonate decarboxylase holo-[acyl-carrier-protein] synthase [Pelosinus fermentans]